MSSGAGAAWSGDGAITPDDGMLVPSSRAEQRLLSGIYRLRKKRIARKQAEFGSERLASLRKGEIVRVVQSCVQPDGAVRARVTDVSGVDAGWVTFDEDCMTLEPEPESESEPEEESPPPLVPTRRRASYPDVAASAGPARERPHTRGGDSSERSRMERPGESAGAPYVDVTYGEPMRSEIPLSERLRKKRERRQAGTKQTRWQARQARELQMQEAYVAGMGSGGGTPSFCGTPVDSECAVCLDQMHDPVMLACGHRFCRACATLVRTTDSRQRCPVCRRPSMRRFFRPDPHRECGEQSQR
eukprot:COSAG02_NODE_4239_length_5597_cov_6.159331_1_plen_301_part_00